MGSKKDRLDVYLYQNGYFDSREKAKTSVMAGLVFVDGKRIDKPGTIIKWEDSLRIEIKGNPNPYVSRGGLKLKKALEIFPISLENKICMDIGASTGGFTDCMLQNGAAKVYAIDVGYGQLDYHLRNHEKVVNMEKTNFRYLDRSLIREKIDFASVDVSFISLDKIFPNLTLLLKEAGEAVALIKPQFEAGREKVGKKGIVKDTAVHKEVILKIKEEGEKNGLTPLGLTVSPIKGTTGNIEFLMYFKKSSNVSEMDFTDLDEMLKKFHEEMNQE